MQQSVVITNRECPARKVPSGEKVTIPSGEFLNVTQALGGNYTVTWRGQMVRIDGTDADAIGYEAEKIQLPKTAGSEIEEAHIWQVLETIYDPEIPVSIVSLGLIYQVEVDQASGKVAIKMTLTAPGCGMGPVLVSDVEYRVGLVPNVQSVAVSLTFDPPWNKDMMTDEAQLETGMFF